MQLTDEYCRYLLNKWGKEYFEKHPYLKIEKASARKLKLDCWSLYLYGKTAKIVYTKCAINPEYIKARNENKKNEKTTFIKSEDERFSNSISRSRSRVFELAMCNEFKYFCTFTQDQKLRDRFNLTEFRKDFTQLIRNINRNRTSENKIQYLLIPEQHKNGAWHLHGLLKGLTNEDLTAFTLKDKIPMKLKKQIMNGETVYNWHRYQRSFGYFTCTEIRNFEATAKYITKYISKDLQAGVIESGNHLFFASQGLKGRETIIKNSYEKCIVDKFDFENDYCKIKYIDLGCENIENKTE